MKLSKARLQKIIKEEIGSLGLGEEGGTGDVQSMLDKYSEEKVYSTRSRARRGVTNSFVLFLKKAPAAPPEVDVGPNRRFYDSLNPGQIYPTERLLHNNKDGTYSIVFTLANNRGEVKSDKLIEGEDFIFVDKVVKSYYVPSGQTP
tara:strand:- start:279 stop:716 length:438 start_codon:yes stop_codon:yes gene_type:complete